MHQISRRFFSGGLLAAIAAVSLVGCGGDSSSGIPRRQTVPVTGGIQQVTANLTGAAPASNNVQTVNISGGGTAVLVPTPNALPANTTVVVIPQGTQVFTGLRRSPTRAPGNVYVDGVNTGVSVDSNGRLDGNIAIVNNRNYEVFVEGPMFIEGQGRRLDINEGFEFNVVVRNNIASLPTQLDGTIPSNDGTADNMALTAIYPGQYLGGTLTLRVTKSNGDVAQSRVLQALSDDEAAATFRDFVPNVVVPAEGVQRVILRFSEG